MRAFLPLNISAVGSVSYCHLTTKQLPLLIMKPKSLVSIEAACLAAQPKNNYSIAIAAFYVS